MNPSKITDLVIHYHRHGFPKKKWTVAGRLFQARMWREYAMDWDSVGLRHDWVKHILKKPRDQCLRLSHVNVYLAKRLNRPRK